MKGRSFTLRAKKKKKQEEKQSGVTLSEHSSCLDWQVISEDKLGSDLERTHHNKNTAAGGSRGKRTTTTNKT